MSDETPRRVRLSAGDPAGGPLIQGELALKLGGEIKTLAISAPDGPVTAQALLPILQGFTDVVVAQGVARASAEGKAVSCRAGCGACCRQIVPVSEAEAHALAALVEGLPPERQALIRERFAAALAALETGGLAERVDHAWRAGDDDIVALGVAYFRLGIACPFLEAESCSIHPDRPLACREYLVVTPAANCRTPSRETIEMVDLAGQPSLALMQADSAATPEGWVPLVAALSFAAAHPPRPPEHTAPEILATVFGRLAGARPT